MLKSIIKLFSKPAIKKKVIPKIIEVNRYTKFMENSGCFNSKPTDIKKNESWGSKVSKLKLEIPKEYHHLFGKFRPDDTVEYEISKLYNIVD